MPSILVTTVGGTCAPVVTAIRDYHPDYVIFIVSSGPRGSKIMVDGPGTPCKVYGDDPNKSNIVKQTGLPADAYEILELTDPDSLNKGYSEIKSLLNNSMIKSRDWRKIADYTGGTKTMTAALVLVAVEMGWELSLVKGARTDLLQVIDGTEIAGLVNTWEVRARQQASLAESLFNSYAYTSASTILESLLQLSPLTLEAQKSIRFWVGLCRGFDAWDRFDHQRAAHLLRPFQSQIVPQWIFLKQITGQSQGSGYERVIDLLLNAERRASRGRYDDSIARNYRALELFAQIRLAHREPPLLTSNLEIDHLPEELHTIYRKRLQNDREGEIRIGLREAYELLNQLNDPLGREFKNEQSKLLSVLEKRNQSILAHGQIPIDREAYLKINNSSQTFFERAFQSLDISDTGIQFPHLSFEIEP